MKPLISAFCCLMVIVSFGNSIAAQSERSAIEIIRHRNYQQLPLGRSAELQTLLESALAKALETNIERPLKKEEIAATVIDLREPARPVWASVRGEEKIYPASVVKMFYMAALERQLEDGKIAMSKELERGLRDMIVDSSNEATQYILDVLTDTSSGAELPPNLFDKWQYQRNRVNRFFTSMGYANINVNQKTFCEDAYGIEQQSRGYKGLNRNMLTTNATARLLAEIVTGRMNTPERTRSMMDLMSRDWSKPSSDGDSQAVGFTGKFLIDRKLAGTKLWSKAGWTSKSRHDAAYIETPDGGRLVLVVFTENHANEKDIIPGIAGHLLGGLKR
jgi:beta-lactamase class A